MRALFTTLSFLILATSSACAQTVIGTFGNWDLGRGVFTVGSAAGSPYCSLTDKVVEIYKQSNPDIPYEALALLQGKKDALGLVYLSRLSDSVGKPISSTFAFDNGTILNVSMQPIPGAFIYREPDQSAEISLIRNILGSFGVTITIPGIISTYVQLNDSRTAIRAFASCLNGL